MCGLKGGCPVRIGACGPQSLSMAVQPSSSQYKCSPRWELRTSLSLGSKCLLYYRPALGPLIAPWAVAFPAPRHSMPSRLRVPRYDQVNTLVPRPSHSLHQVPGTQSRSMRPHPSSGIQCFIALGIQCLCPDCIWVVKEGSFDLQLLRSGSYSWTQP